MLKKAKGSAPCSEKKTTEKEKNEKALKKGKKEYDKKRIAKSLFFKLIFNYEELV